MHNRQYTWRPSFLRLCAAKASSGLSSLHLGHVFMPKYMSRTLSETNVVDRRHSGYDFHHRAIKQQPLRSAYPPLPVIVAHSLQWDRRESNPHSEVKSFVRYRYDHDPIHTQDTRSARRFTVPCHYPLAAPFFCSVRDMCVTHVLVSPSDPYALFPDLVALSLPPFPLLPVVSLFDHGIQLDLAGRDHAQLRKQYLAFGHLLVGELPCEAT